MGLAPRRHRGTISRVTPLRPFKRVTEVSESITFSRLVPPPETCKDKTIAGIASSHRHRGAKPVVLVLLRMGALLELHQLHVASPWKEHSLTAVARLGSGSSRSQLAFAHF
jgi:hypothetical protein